MNILITGGSGFVGSHTADVLTKAGHKVRILDLFPSPYLKKNQQMIVGDILDDKLLKRAVKDCDYIYHFAGIADLDDATTKSVETIKQNILGTAAVLDKARGQKIKRFIYASTIYSQSKKGGFYRCSKQAAELYVEEYQRRYGLNFTIVRYGTLYGRRADIRNSVYRYIYQALSRKRIAYTGNGKEMREYINVEDAARLNAEILMPQYKNQYVVITGPYPIKLKELFFTIKEILGGKVRIERISSSNSAHYTITPYSFTIPTTHKLTSNYYVDIGQGLLECINEIYIKAPGIRTKNKRA